MEWGFLSAGELAASLRAREVTSAELTDDAISRIERDDKAINSICVPDFDGARAAASQADEARASGMEGPLLGIPMTVKESYNIAGLPTTWGMPQFANYLPSEDALVVSRLKAAGSVILGKTNVPFMLQDWQSYNEIYGTTNNPWDLARTSGGSSGGSAAALALGFGALSVGSDLAGSLRNPAHFCGVYAHKPTFGLVPTRGMVPPDAPSFPVEGDLGVCGPMARTAHDLSVLLDVIAGPDPSAWNQSSSPRGSATGTRRRRAVWRCAKYQLSMSPCWEASGSSGCAASSVEPCSLRTSCPQAEAGSRSASAKR